MARTIELYRNEDLLLNDAIDRLVVDTHTYRQQLGYKSFLFSGCGTESGTTTITIDLAIALSMAGWKTILVDCDFRKGGRYKKIAENTDIGLSDYLANTVEREDVIYPTTYELLDLIPSGKNVSSPVRLLCSQRMEEIIQQLKKTYDYVLFDFPSVNVVPDANTTFAFVDGIVLVAALNQTTKRQVSDARRKVMQYAEKYCGIVVNRVEISQYKHYIKDYDYFRQKNMEKKQALHLRRKAKKKEKA